MISTATTTLTWTRSLTALAGLTVLLAAGALTGCGRAYGTGPGGGECCPLASAPTCDCAELGGSPDPSTGTCGNSICDASPGGWERTVDENGCPMWKVTGGRGSCGAAPPAPPPGDGDDPGDPGPAACETATYDIPGRDTAEAICPPDGSRACTICVQSLDRAGQPRNYLVLEGKCGCPEPEPGPAFACCPIAAEPSCGCTDLGGSPDPAGNCYNSICDAVPVGWTMTTDENGCPEWIPNGASCLDSPPPPPPPACSGPATSDVPDEKTASAICAQQSECTVCVGTVDAATGEPRSYTVHESTCSCREPTPA